MRFSASSVALLASLLPAASATIYYAGVDESGGEFGVWSNTATVGTGLPGEFGVTYQFIDEAGIEVFVDQDKVSGDLPQDEAPRSSRGATCAD